MRAQREEVSEDAPEALAHGGLQVARDRARLGLVEALGGQDQGAGPLGGADGGHCGAEGRDEGKGLAVLPGAGD
jgi:hypothetical protein